MKRVLFAVAAALFFLAAAPGAFKPGQHVEVEYIPDSGKWLPATIVEVLNDGYSYKVKVAPYGDGKTIVADIHYKRVRAAANVPKRKNAVTAPTVGSLVFGKYGCTASTYAGTAVEYQPRGFFTLSKNHTYTYSGFRKPSAGSFRVDSHGNLVFQGGYFGGGLATKIDRPNKFFVTFPSNPDNRWTCGLVQP